jgi:hypothetical protein
MTVPGEQLHIARAYTRSDPRGVFPSRRGLPELSLNRLAVFWRPMIDMERSDYTSLRLRAIPLVSSWLTDPARGCRSWFSMIGVPGQRRQVLRHAGLDQYDCPEPGGLAEELRTARWSTLTMAIENFANLDYAARALLVFHLAQLSYCRFAAELCGDVWPNRDPAHDRYIYEVARVHARYPGHAEKALSLFGSLAEASRDESLALAACFQGIGHTLRNGKSPHLARAFFERGKRFAAQNVHGDWHAHLLRSRFHRAVALLRLAERDIGGLRHHLDLALAHHQALVAGPVDEADTIVALENSRYLLELRIRAALSQDDPRVVVFSTELSEVDPYCVEARLLVGDGHAAVGRYSEAARWFARAGELGTAAGAVGWYRAGQCFDFIGDRGSAINAMGRCVELDATAIEPRQYLRSARCEPR